jgi:hypothetical protein
MGVNVIRQYTGIPAKWIEYIYENYGIYTMLNHTFGRYGLTINGVWVLNTEYSNPSTQQLLIAEAKAMVEYKNTQGYCCFIGKKITMVFWDGAETENIPLEDRESTISTCSYKLLIKR